MKKKILDLKPKIIEIMTKHEDIRDNDFALYFRIMGYLCDKNKNPDVIYNTDKITAHQLLKGMSQGIYPDITYVARCRRTVENEHELLRGNSYYKRHNEIEKEIKEELGYKATNLLTAPGVTP
jgi:hypothetical protein